MAVPKEVLQRHKAKDEAPTLLLLKTETARADKMLFSTVRMPGIGTECEAHRCFRVDRNLPQDGPERQSDHGLPSGGLHRKMHAVALLPQRGPIRAQETAPP